MSKDVSEHIEKLLGISFNDAKVDKDILRKHLIENPKDKKKLEKYVHGLVREEVEKFLLTSNSKIRVVEVPLLFESKFDMMFDTIIVTDIKEEKQLSLLKNRDGFKSDDLKVINSNNQIDQNKNSFSVSKPTKIIAYFREKIFCKYIPYNNDCKSNDTFR